MQLEHITELPQEFNPLLQRNTAKATLSSSETFLCVGINGCSWNNKYFFRFSGTFLPILYHRTYASRIGKCEVMYFSKL